MKKMMNYLLIGMLTFTMACDEVTDNGGDGINPSCLLTKITSLVEDDGYILTLGYNSTKQLVRFVETEEGVNVGVTTVDYDSQGRITNSTYEREGEEYSKTTYTWVDNSYEEMYSFKNDDGTWMESEYKQSYELDENGKIVKSQGYYNNDGEWVKDTDYSIYTWINGNNTKGEHFGSNKSGSLASKLLSRKLQHKRLATLKSANEDLQGTTISEYDDKMNTYSSIGLIANIMALNTNNIIKSEHKSGDYSYSENHEYEYNEEGYPTKVTSTYNYNGDIETGESVFEYSCE